MPLDLSLSAPRAMLKGLSTALFATIEEKTTFGVWKDSCVLVSFNACDESSPRGIMDSATDST
jgi:hypothetical protein